MNIKSVGLRSSSLSSVISPYNLQAKKSIEANSSNPIGLNYVKVGMLSPLYFHPSFKGQASSRDILGQIEPSYTKGQYKNSEYKKGDSPYSTDKIDSQITGIDVQKEENGKGGERVYHFAMKPGCLKGQQINIIGSGSIFENFLNIGNIVNRYFANPEDPSSTIDQKLKNITMFDPKFNKPEFREKFDRYSITDSINGIQEGVAFIFSPTQFHAEQMCDLARNENNLQGIYTDKPICINEQELNELKELVETTNKPIYFGDYFFFGNIPGLRLLGVNMPYKEAVTLEFDNTKNQKFKTCLDNATPYFEPKDIESIEARIVETGDKSLINRKWLQVKDQGGGVLLDLMTHLLNLLNLADFELDENTIEVIQAKKSKLVGEEHVKTPRTSDPNQFEDIPDGEVEDLVEIKGKVKKGGYEIPITLKSAQYEKDRENYILITSKSGEKLRLSTDVFDKKVEILRKEKNKISGKEEDVVFARAWTLSDPYSLMIPHVLEYVKSYEEGKCAAPMFWDVNKRTMEQIFAIKEKAGIKPPVVNWPKKKQRVKPTNTGSHTDVHLSFGSHLSTVA